MIFLSGFGVGGLAVENAGGIKGLGAAVQAEEEFEELTCDRGHGDRTGHSGGFFAVIIGAEQLRAHDKFKYGLSEDRAQTGAAAFGLSFFSAMLAALLRAKVHAGVTQELGEGFKIVQGPGLGQNARE